MEKALNDHVLKEASESFGKKAESINKSDNTSTDAAGLYTKYKKSIDECRVHGYNATLQKFNSEMAIMKKMTPEAAKIRNEYLDVLRSALGLV